MKIYVSEEDIEEGRKFNPASCPIARALERQLDDWSDPSVHNLGITARNRKDGLFYYMDVPESARRKIQEFIYIFDNDLKPVKPFSFLLDEKNFEIV